MKQRRRKRDNNLRLRRPLVVNWACKKKPFDLVKNNFIPNNWRKWDSKEEGEGGEGEGVEERGRNPRILGNPKEVEFNLPTWRNEALSPDKARK